MDKNTSTPKLHVLKYEKNNVDAFLFINFPLLQVTSQRITTLPVIMMIDSNGPVISDFSFTTGSVQEVLYKLQFLRLKDAQYTKF